VRDEWTDEEIVDLHDESAHNPQDWYYCAETLFTSASHLMYGLHQGPAAKRLETGGRMDSHFLSYGLLLGYSLECVCKGLWVAAGNRIVTNRKVTGIDGVNDHDLLGLTRKVGLALSTDESTVVNRLSYVVKAAGRYPVPKYPREMLPRTVKGRGPVDPAHFSMDDWALASNVTGRILNELHNKMY